MIESKLTGAVSHRPTSVAQGKHHQHRLNNGAPPTKNQVNAARILLKTADRSFACHATAFDQFDRCNFKALISRSACSREPRFRRLEICLQNTRGWPKFRGTWPCLSSTKFKPTLLFQALFSSVILDSSVPRLLWSP